MMTYQFLAIGETKQNLSASIVGMEEKGINKQGR